MTEGSDVLVVGGGVIGSGIAWRLAQAGVRVGLIERSEPGSEASSAAAGILAPQAEAEGPGPFLALGLQSRDLYPTFAAELLEESGIDIGYRPTGALELARTEAELSGLRAKLGWQSAAGLSCEEVTPVEIAELEPALARNWRGGFLLAKEAQVENRALARALPIAAVRAGAKLRRGQVARLISSQARVLGVELADGTRLDAERVVIAAGAWSSAIEGLESTVAVEPVRGQMVELQADPHLLARVAFVPGGYLVPRADGRILVGSTSERVGFDKRVTPEGLEGLLARSRESLPGLAAAPLLSSWAGLRPGSADGLPVLGAHPTLRGVHLATGHFRNGILLTPITARLVADSVLGQSDPTLLEAFRPGRHRTS